MGRYSARKAVAATTGRTTRSGMMLTGLNGPWLPGPPASPCPRSTPSPSRSPSCRPATAATAKAKRQERSKSMRERKLTFSIFRYNPYDPESEPRMQEYVLVETPRMTLFTALSRIREEIDPSLQFDFVCRSAICGSCALLVNGRPRLACHTRTEDLPDKITLLPL